MAYRFERMHVWNDARRFVVLVYRITKMLPKSEQFALSDQLRRAAISIVLNIAEGSDRKSDIEFIRYLRIAVTSVNEVVAGMYIAKDLLYIDDRLFEEVYSSANALSLRLNALIRSIRKSQISGRKP